MRILNTLPIGHGPIYDKDFQCTGTESSLGRCTVLVRNDSLCGHVDDVGIECQGRYHVTSYHGMEKIVIVLIRLFNSRSFIFMCERKTVVKYMK